jgi:uncharacterized protein (TIGR03083 family)
MSNELDALRNSVDRLGDVVGRLGPDQVRQPAYPTEWSIADTLSHLGSGAVISTAVVEDVVQGRAPDPNFNQSVWDEWNAKDPESQAADVLTADRALLGALDGMDDAQRGAFRFSMGPFELDFAGYVGLRLNEHVVHVWDVEVVLDPTATLPDDASEVMIGSLGMIAGFAGKPIGAERAVTITTSTPVRGVTVALGLDAVQLSLSDPVASPDLTLPAEAFIRLVYGRLDEDHTPPDVGGGALHDLRRAFTGF